ncbi:hypothetical protein CYLTODRAFT_415545, partial [Cylindrobasidium torrendii FP15055 ss-10]
MSFSSTPRSTGVPLQPTYRVEQPATLDRQLIRRTPQPQPGKTAKITTDTDVESASRSKKRTFEPDASTGSSKALVLASATATGGPRGEKWRAVEDARTLGQLHDAQQEIDQLKKDKDALEDQSKETKSSLTTLLADMERMSHRLADMDDFKRESEYTQAKQASDISNLNAHVADLKEQLVQVTTERDAARAE